MYIPVTCKFHKIQEQFWIHSLIRLLTHFTINFRVVEPWGLPQASMGNFRGFDPTGYPTRQGLTITFVGYRIKMWMPARSGGRTNILVVFDISYDDVPSSLSWAWRTQMQTVWFQKPVWGEALKSKKEKTYNFFNWLRFFNWAIFACKIYLLY